MIITSIPFRGSKIELTTGETDPTVVAMTKISQAKTVEAAIFVCCA